MFRVLLVLGFVVVILVGCAEKPLPPVSVVMPERRIDYRAEVKPVLDKRCVVCHSCYNSPCQLKLNSFEGVDRGASKKAIYDASRLRTMEPSRLFIDAQKTSEWREKDFFSVTESSVKEGGNNAIMLQLLSHKMKNPKSQGNYFPEAGDLSCAENGSELATYLNKHPNWGMPFGFPPLKPEEYNTIAGWIVQGAKGPTEVEQKTLSAIAGPDIAEVIKWETFFNTTDPKHVTTARYLYEHLFLAHITFKTGSGVFYELVRSRTAQGGPVDVIQTVRPYDDPGDEPFYYRFRRIHSTIVHKTHMVFPLDREQFARLKELFIDVDWLQQPHVVSYDDQVSADPFLVFEQIPPRSRYQFLLDNANYIIMTFIRGPVCKGQVALNVVNDHFWIMFLDPDHDLAVRHPGFLKLHRHDLIMPVAQGSDYRLFRALHNRHFKAAIKYYKARQDFYSSYHYNGQKLDSIWKGRRASDTPVLTVFRHFDSASVHKGALGELPRTAWVMDYPLLERIYYSLVAGFDVYGTAGHQLAVRLYMDRLRIEGESYFLDFLPLSDRKKTMQEWYTGVDFKTINYHPTSSPAAIPYNTDDPQRELIEKVVEEHIVAETGIQFDHNYQRAGEQYPDLPKSYQRLEDYLQGFHAVSAPGTAFFRYVTDQHVNLSHIRIRIPDQEDAIVSMVIHRWHDNVTFLFSEKNTLNPKKDKADFISGFVGSYPNYYVDLTVDDLPEFFYLLANFNGSEEHVMRLKKFGVNRAEEHFWEVYDWFQDRFNQDAPDTAGIFDLNRYFYEAKK